MAQKSIKKPFDFAANSKLWRSNQKKLLGEEQFNANEAQRKYNERYFTISMLKNF